MKNVSIITQPKMVAFDLKGSLNDLSSIRNFLKQQSIFIDVSHDPYRFGSSHDDDYIMSVGCSEKDYESVMELTKSFIAE